MDFTNNPIVHKKELVAEKCMIYGFNPKELDEVPDYQHVFFMLGLLDTYLKDSNSLSEAFEKCAADYIVEQNPEECRINPFSLDEQVMNL